MSSFLLEWYILREVDLRDSPVVVLDHNDNGFTSWSLVCSIKSWAWDGVKGAGSSMQCQVFDKKKNSTLSWSNLRSSPYFLEILSFITNYLSSLELAETFDHCVWLPAGHKLGHIGPTSSDLTQKSVFATSTNKMSPTVGFIQYGLRRTNFYLEFEGPLKVLWIYILSRVCWSRVSSPRAYR